MKNLKLKFIGNTILVIYFFITVCLGTRLLVDMLLFGTVSWTREDIIDDFWTSFIMSVLFFIVFDGSKWLKRRREIFSRPLEETPDAQS